MSSATSFGDLIEYGVPTLDRPFGLKLWPIFNKAFELVVGYPADDFRFVAGKTPMSTLKETSIFIVVYYIIIFGGREIMRNRDAFKLKALFLVHNFVLTAVSFILLVLYAEQLIPTVTRNGIFYAICASEGGWTQPLVVLYYVRCFPLGRMAPGAQKTRTMEQNTNNLPRQLTYLTKYLELLDTVFLFLKKKPLSMSTVPPPLHPLHQPPY